MRAVHSDRTVGGWGLEVIVLEGTLVHGEPDILLVQIRLVLAEWVVGRMALLVLRLAGS